MLTGGPYTDTSSWKIFLRGPAGIPPRVLARHISGDSKDNPVNWIVEHGGALASLARRHG